jgi:hypothetical protein
LLLAAVILALGCASHTDVFSTDLTKQAGVYVVGYTTDAAARTALEDQLVTDLESREMVAWPSHADLATLETRDAADVIAAADRHDAAAVILINQVAADASDSLVKDPQRITPLHPDLRTFFQESRDEMVDNHAAAQPVFAEVNLFLIDGKATRLYWSGTTWSFHADGQGTAVRGISEVIADQLRDARDSLTTGPFSRKSEPGQ